MPKNLTAWYLPLILLAVVVLACAGISWLSANPHAIETLFARYYQRQVLAPTREPGWVQVRVGGFLISHMQGDPGAAEVIAAVADAHWQVGSFFPGKLPEETPIVIYPDLQSMSEAMGKELPTWGMGSAMGPMLLLRSPASWTEQQRAESSVVQIVTHEYTHVVTWHVTRRVPPWLNEGLAVYVAGQFQPEWNRDLAAAVSLYTLDEIDQLFKHPGSAAADKAGRAYRQSGSLVSYLAETYGPEGLRQLLVELGAGRSVGQAVERALGLTLSQLEQAWRDSLLRELASQISLSP